MKNQYAMTEAQVEALAAERAKASVSAELVDGTYIKVLVTAVQAKLGPKRGRAPSLQSQLDTLDAVSVPFYAAVLRGVTTPDIEVDATMGAAEVKKRTHERNRRANFARSAKATLVAWTREGGDLRSLNAETVTKTELRVSTLAAQADRATTPQTKIERAQNTIVAAAAREGPEQARVYLENAILALQKALEELPDEDSKQVKAKTFIGIRKPALIHVNAH